jgi:predicted nucleic acid-binding protein
MPKPRIYVETTIPSTYHSGRNDAKMAALRAATREWWAIALASSDLVTSTAVLDELARGHPEYSAQRLSLLHGLPVLEADQASSATAAVYIRHKLMPADPRGDALHLALASHHRCDVLATWNYHHLANPNKLVRIRTLNEELGISVPRILTPRQLMEEAS